MSLTRKNRFEHFRQSLINSARPIGPKEFEQMRTAVVDALDATGHLVVQKAKRTERPDSILEITCSWTAIDSSHEAIIESLEAAWPGKDLPETEELHFIEPREEAVLLQSVSKADGGRYASAKILVLV